MLSVLFHLQQKYELFKKKEIKCGGFYLDKMIDRMW